MGKPDHSQSTLGKKQNEIIIAALLFVSVTTARHMSKIISHSYFIVSPLRSDVQQSVPVGTEVCTEHSYHSIQKVLQGKAQFCLGILLLVRGDQSEIKSSQSFTLNMYRNTWANNNIIHFLLQLQNKLN